MSSVPPKSDVVIRIVDDDDAIRRALTRLIESMGMRVETFASPEELLAHDLASDTGCLLLDVKLPGMDGFELHERIVEDGNDVPVIFITAHPHEASRSRAKQADAVAFLEKPFDDDMLLAAIREALEGAG